MIRWLAFVVVMLLAGCAADASTSPEEPSTASGIFIDLPDGFEYVKPQSNASAVFNVFSDGTDSFSAGRWLPEWPELSGDIVTQ